MENVRANLHRRLEEQGYVVVPTVVPGENLEAVLADIWSHTGADAHNRDSWYQSERISPNGMVEMYHYQSMWDNRQHPRVHQVFSDLFGSEKLWVSLDRTNLKPPADPRYPHFDSKGFIHWDIDINRYPDIPFGVQGVLALTDTDEEMGGFQCIPEMYQELDAWIARKRQEQQPLSRNPDITGYSITKVPLHAGDMVIWSKLMPHGNGRNVSDRPRLAQYITMSLAQEGSEEERQKRINCWQHNLPPPYPYFPGDPRKIEEQREKPAELTELGRKLLGLESW
jgi:ectoine hydroxylase-related dioxygenase (phytanoyl-CoA dioxygenase family)